MGTLGTCGDVMLALTAVEDGAVGTAPSPSAALRTAELSLGLGVYVIPHVWRRADQLQLLRGSEGREKVRATQAL